MTSLRHPPHRLDLSLADWLRAAAALGRRDDRRARAALEASWAPTGDGLAFLSVRSAFDCALAALGWPRGSEVLVSAINIRDMVDLLAHHGLVAVPLDLDPRTLIPRRGAIARAATPRTRGLLVAHLFGAVADLAPLFAEAHRHRLVCVEDAAQAFRHPDARGGAGADLSLFSFGTIKTATALGGALVRVGDPALRDRMRAIQDGWPRQPRRRYAAKLAVALGFLALQRPTIYRLFGAACRRFGTDAGAVTRRMSRGFGGLAPDAMLAALRHRPSAPLLATLHGRLARFADRGAGRMAARSWWGRAIAARAVVAGADHPIHTHWLVPLVVDDPAAVRAALAAVGVDASGPSNVIGLGAAARLIERVVFVPAYPELPAAARAAVLAIAAAAAPSAAAPSSSSSPTPREAAC